MIAKIIEEVFGSIPIIGLVIGNILYLIRQILKPGFQEKFK